MGDTQTQRVYRMIDNLTDTMSWAELAKELDRYASQIQPSSEVSAESVEIEKLIHTVRNKAAGGQGSA